MAKLKTQDPFRDVSVGRLLTVRFALSLLLMVVGIAWIAYYYVAVRPDGGFYGPGIDPGGPTFMGDLEKYNYLIGFALFFFGLAISAHPATPLGRGRGVVVGMLACFVLGLAWICVFYAIANNVDSLPIFDDLGQKNLIVGIVFMAVGFTFATRWE